MYVFDGKYEKQGNLLGNLSSQTSPQVTPLCLALTAKANGMWEDVDELVYLLLSKGSDPNYTTKGNLYCPIIRISWLELTIESSQ